MNDSFQGQENKLNSRVDDEITLKDIIMKIQYWFSIVWQNRLRIIALSLLIGLFTALYTKFLTKPTYTASYQLFFQEEAGSFSGAMRLASSFGFGSMLGGSASSSASVQEFITSRNNIVHAMTTNMKNGLLIERYFTGRFAESEEFKKEFTSNFGTNQRYTDSTLTEIYRELNIEGVSTVFDEKTSTIAFDVIAEHESFAFDLAVALVKNTEEQFKNWKKEKSLSAVDAFQKKVDSLEVAIDYALLELGLYEDQNNLLVSSVDKMKRIRLTIDLESLKLAYGEYVKGLEMSKAELMNLDPPFKYFDEPTYPLKKEEGSLVISYIFGSFIAAFLLVLFFIGRVEVKNVMA